MRWIKLRQVTEMATAVRYFSDAPVYRLPAARYHAERDRYVARMLYPGNRRLRVALRKLHAHEPASGAAFTGHLQTLYGGCWEFNEIIGYIRLHFVGALLRAEYFCVDRNQIARTRTKTFDYVTHELVPPSAISPRATSRTIWRLITRQLDACQRVLRADTSNARTSPRSVPTSTGAGSTRPADTRIGRRHPANGTSPSAQSWPVATKPRRWRSASVPIPCPASHHKEKPTAKPPS
jgi:hypothetical protein